MSIRIWFLIQQFVARHDLPEYNHIPFVNYFHCRRCRARLAYLQIVDELVHARFLFRLFNVEVAEDERYHRVIDDMTQAETHCVDCRNLLGWKIIAVSEPSVSGSVGGFYLNLDEFISWNNVTLRDFLFGGNNEQAPNDQDGGADEEQDYDQNGGASEQNADQDRDANEQVSNEQNADQDEEHDHDQNGGCNEQNADQDGQANEQVPNEQNADQDEEQDLGTNEQNSDQDGDASS